MATAIGSCDIHALVCLHVNVAVAIAAAKGIAAGAASVATAARGATSTAEAILAVKRVIDRASDVGRSIHQALGVAFQACVVESHVGREVIHVDFLEVGVDGADILGVDGGSRGGRQGSNEDNELHVGEWFNGACLKCRRSVEEV